MFKKKKCTRMEVTIRQVTSRSDLRAFVKFPEELYKNSPYYVPKIFLDEMGTLTASSNPAFKFCDTGFFLAYKGDEIVGRVAAIVNNRANAQWNHMEVRYGWFDFIDDIEVSKALIDTVMDFGRKHGMTSIAGPLGFTDFDAEGMLVEGYDQICTMPLIYNYPYYPKHMEAMGFTKVVDWLEYKVYLPVGIPEKISKISELVSEKYKLHVHKITRWDVIHNNAGGKIFDLINETYCNLFDFTILPPDLVKKYINTYIMLVDLKMVSTVEDEEGNMVAFGISMPSIVRALQKCRGRLFPTGWFYLIRSMFFRREENLELLLVSVKPEYQSKGVYAMLFNDLIPIYLKYGFKYAETNAELEDNLKVRGPWDYFEKDQHKRRRVYGKNL